MSKTKDVWVHDFWGWIKVPEGTSEIHTSALAHIAWRGGIHEDSYKRVFAKWFRAFAKRRPDLAQIKVFDVYPVDEFRWIGPYEPSSYEDPRVKESS